MEKINKEKEKTNEGKNDVKEPQSATNSGAKEAPAEPRRSSRKRVSGERPGLVPTTSEDDTEVAETRPIFLLPKRGRGRPSTTGRCIGGRKNKTTRKGDEESLPTASEDESPSLRKEVKELRAQLAEALNNVERLTKEVASLRQPTDSRVHETESLMGRFAALVDEKLAEFRGELFPGRAVRPPLKADAARAVPAAGMALPSSLPKNKNKKGKKGNPRQTLPLPPSLPPVPMHSTQDVAKPNAWVKVVGRRTRGQKAGAIPSTRRAREEIKPARLPASAAIAVTLREDAVTTLGQAMATAKQNIKLADFGIQGLREKRAVTGGLLLEVSGPDCTSKADALATRMREVLGDLNVNIARPMKMGEVRIADLDDAATPQEVAGAIAAAAGCAVESVRVGEIRRDSHRLGTVWARCPLAAVRKLATAKRVVVGWGESRVEVLAARRLQCFRCLEFGHVRARCPSTVDRSDRCYACGVQGHQASRCTAQTLKCPLCTDLGRPSAHRLGTRSCAPRTSSKNGRNMATGPPKTVTTVSPSEPGPSTVRPAEEVMEQAS